MVMLAVTQNYCSRVVVLTPAYSFDARIMSIGAYDPINSLSEIVNMVL